MDQNSIEVRLARSDCVGSNAVDGTGNTLWNDSDEYGDVTSECEEDEGTDREDGDNDTDWFRYTVSYMLCAFGIDEFDIQRICAS